MDGLRPSALCSNFDEEIGAAGSHCRGSRSIEEREPELLYVFSVPARPTFADLVGMTLEACGPLWDAITARRIFSHPLPQHFFGDFPSLVSEIQPFFAIDIEVVNPGLRRHAGHASNVCPTTGPAR